MKKRGAVLREHPQEVPLRRTPLAFSELLEDLKFAIFNNQYNRVVNRISDVIEREPSQNRVQVCDIR